MTPQEDDDFYVKMDAAFMETAAVRYAHDLRYQRYVNHLLIVALLGSISTSVAILLQSPVQVRFSIIAVLLWFSFTHGTLFLCSWRKVKRMEKKNLVMFRDGMMARLGEAPDPFEFHAEMRKFMEFSKRKMEERFEEGAHE